MLSYKVGARRNGFPIAKSKFDYASKIDILKFNKSTFFKLVLF